MKIVKKNKKFPLVCILVLNWNGEKIIGQCIKSMKKTDYPNYKFIIIDNGSTDKSNKIISKFNVELIPLSENKGYTSGFNYGWNYCLKKYNPKYICNLNNDIKITQGEWLSLMVDELEKSKSRGICSNKTLASKSVLETQHFDKEKNYLQKDKGQYDFIKEVETLGGGLMLVKKEVIKKIGGLDENFFFGPDDMDYCLRARKERFKLIFNGFSKAIHLGSYTRRSSNKNFIYKHQSYGYILFSLRYENLINKIKVCLTQLLRVFVTRKDPFGDNGLLNIYFHKRFPIRFLIFIKSFISAFKNYKTIKISKEYNLLKGH